MQFTRSKVVAVATAIICAAAVVAAGGATTVGIASASSSRSEVTHTANAVRAVANASHHGGQYPYTVIDPGTFGGPNSYFDGPGVPLTSNGTLVGQADTSTLDSDYPNCPPPPGGCPDHYIQHAFTWQDGRLTDLGALSGQNDSAIYELNGSGVGVGSSENGHVDPNTGTAAQVAVIFEHGQVISLGALPGGNESFAQDINDQGQVAGFSSNGILDPYSMFKWGTETRTFVWRKGVMQDIGDLGGPDTVEQTENERGQIAGQSYTNDTPSPYTGVPTTDPFLWENGHMIDLGTLGGDYGNTSWMNDSGEVVGFSEMAGDKAAQPFLWDGRGMIDLGTLGGAGGSANWINDDGDVAGAAQLSDGAWNGVLWTHGKTIDLPPVDGAPNAFANSLNDQDEVVGTTLDGNFNNLNAILWTGGSAYDLNTLIAPSALHMTSAEYIDDQGDIVADAVLSNGDQRMVLLVPNHAVPLPPAPTTAGTQVTTGSGNGGTTTDFAFRAARDGVEFTALHQLMANRGSSE